MTESDPETLPLFPSPVCWIRTGTPVRSSTARPMGIY
jgi:hypothetical protein